MDHGCEYIKICVVFTSVHVNSVKKNTYSIHCLRFIQLNQYRNASCCLAVRGPHNITWNHNAVVPEINRTMVPTS